MKALRTWLLALMAAALVGCASAPSDDGGEAGPAAEASDGAASEAAQAANGDVAGGETTDAGAAESEKQTAPPTDPEVLFSVIAAEMAGYEEDFEAAANHYVDAAMKSRDPAIAERATRVALYADNLERAGRAAERWLELAPRNAAAHQIAASLAVRGGDPQRARQRLGGALRHLGQTEAKSWRFLARTLAQLEDRELASELAHAMIARYKDIDLPPEARYQQARMAMSVQAHPLALELLDGVLAERADWAQALVLRAQVHSAVGNQKKAAADYGRAVEQQPDNRELRLTYASVLHDLGDYERAQSQLSEIEQDPVVLFSRAAYAAEAGKLEQAGEFYEQMVAAEPEREHRYHLLLGQLAQVLERWDEALRWYEKIPAGNEHYAKARMRIASTLAETGDIEAARLELSELRSQSEDETTVVDAYLREARILTDAERLQAAWDLYTAALERKPDNSQLLYARALLAERMDRIDRTEADLRRLLEIQPNDAAALNALGYTLADRTERYEEALALIRRALELAPGEPAIVDSMGWVQFRLGNHEAAVKHLRRALALGFDAEIAAHLGEVLWTMGKRSEAMSVWEEALDKAPDNEVLQGTLERLVE